MRRALLPLAVAGVVAALALLLRPGGTSHSQKPQPRTVEVRVTGPTGVSEVATGFVAGPSRVVTVAHVLDSVGALTVQDGRGGPRRAEALKVDRRDDLALLAVPGLPAAGSEPAAAGVRIVVRRRGAWTALPTQVRRRFTVHVHGRPGDPVYTRPALELAASVRIGDSGAPVITARGELAGVVFARSEDRPGTAYAVDAKAVGALLGPG
jgi:S1-C subfamily serine protease